MSRALVPAAIEPGQPFLERTLSDAEYGAALTTQDAADALAAITRTLDDLLDRDALFRHFPNGLVCLLAAQESFILQPLGIGQKHRPANASPQ